MGPDRFARRVKTPYERRERERERERKKERKKERAFL
jgi:hypothetical protein